MNDKDKEAFEKWFKENSYDYYGYEKNNQEIGWQTACEYKQKEIDKLQAENIKLMECVVLAANACCYTEYEEACSFAKKVLREIKNLLSKGA